MNLILAGATVMGYMVASLFFLRYWTRTRDSLFIYFSVSFFILAVQRLALAVTTEQYETTALFYVMRLAAFLLILYAIWVKNRPKASQGME